MRKIVIDKKHNEKKLNNVLLDIFKNLNQNVLFKALRQKDIKVNGKRVKENIMVYENDIIEIFISDDLLLGNKIINFDVVYDDENIMVINKPAGISVTEEAGGSNICLTKIVKEKYGANLEPCHRLDRNTKGLIIFAKNSKALDIMLGKFKSQQIEKHYKTQVYGILPEKHKILKDYLFKDNKKNIVYISDIPQKGYQEIITEYQVISEDKKDNTSILDVNLHTGKTHQIRAHLAYIGFPIIGDGKYGNNSINKKFNKKVQELKSYKIIFKFDNDSGILNYLKDLTLEID